MSKSLYDEAIADAKSLRDAAEQNAKNAIVEAVTPRIRDFIEEQLLGKSETQATLDEDVLDSVISESLGSKTTKENEQVVLDESALERLIETFSGGEKIRGPHRFLARGAIHETFSALDSETQQKVMSVANKLDKSLDTLSESGIVNDVSVKQEKSTMPRNDDILYEVDLQALTEAMKHDMEEDGHGKKEMAMKSMDEMEPNELKELSAGDPDEAMDLNLDDILSELGDMQAEEAMSAQDETYGMDMEEVDYKEVDYKEGAHDKDAALKEALRILSDKVIFLDLMH